TQSVMKYFETLQRVPSLSEQKNSFETYVNHAYAIYHKLLAPVIESIDDENLVIIRDGPLLLIPFESLPVSKSNSSYGDYQQLDYLIRRHNISYAHSADLLVKSVSRIKPNAAENKVLAFSYSQLSPSSGVSTNRSINELPGAAREIQAISEILPGSFFLGEEATEQKFKSHAADFDILHLAVHGKSDPEKQFSGSLFFKQSQDKQDDGELHVYELYDLSLKARLTVLSACESGVGKFFRGEGVFSIARGFAYAGCPATVMTLWPISDISSATIMADFYTELNDGENIDVALRKAKLNYLENTDPQLAHPTYWAAFIPTGNMEPVIVPRFSSSIRWILTAVAFILFAWFVFKYRYYNRDQTHHPKQHV
ncbi:MAG: CHAT domain-containing protein, partial [Cyclobacteriaceae bacterium]